MYDFLNNYSENTRLWLYQSPRAFTAEELQWIKQEGELFSDSWKTHGTSMKALVHVIMDRFIVVAADQEVTENSGCSIDSSVRFIKGIENRTGLDLMNRMLVYYLNEQGEPVSFHFHDLAKLLESGAISGNTPIFNPLVNSKTALLNEWQTPLDRSWMAAFVK